MSTGTALSRKTAGAVLKYRAGKGKPACCLTDRGILPGRRIIIMNESQSRRHCLKCLLSEIDEEAYRKNILRVTELMKVSERASDKVKERRLDICRSCDYLDSGTCRACGCYVELRAASRGGRCPYKKWT